MEEWKALVTGGTFNPCSKKKLISGAVWLCEDSEVCSEGIAGRVEVAEPATGSTLMGETGHMAVFWYFIQNHVLKVALHMLSACVSIGINVTVNSISV